MVGTPHEAGQTPRPRPAFALALLCVLFASAPARAQSRDAFVESTLQFVQAAEGEFGDEGRYVLAAIDGMGRVLREWDTALTRSDGALSIEASKSPAPAAARIHLAIAALYIERGRFERALVSLGWAASIEPDGADAHLLRGLALDRLGRTDLATAAYREAWRRQPLTLAAAYRVALAPGGRVVSQAERAEAVAELVAAAAHPESGRRLLFPTDALLDDASAPAPLLPLARYAPAFALLGQGRYDEAVTALRAAAAGDPLTRAPADVVAAGGALRAGDAAGALERLTPAAASPTAPAETHRVLALAWRASGDTTQAMKELRAAIALDPSDERAWLALGDATAPASSRARWRAGQTALAAGDWAAAVEALEPTTAPRPLAGASALYGALVRAYRARADAMAVVRVLRATVEAQPHSSAAHAELAGALRVAGRADEAAVEELAAKLLR
jgi:tetratricopeptide (TPR) repeat protein